MDSISSIKIIGFDLNRPPTVRKESYIDLFFKLSNKTTPEWSENFNKLGSQIEPSAKIDKNNSIFIQTWVRDMQLIPEHLEKIKLKIIQCNQEIEENLRLQQLALATKNASLLGMDGEQNKLNKIIAALDFEN